MGWASGLQAGMRLGETLRQGQLERELADEAKKYKVTEGAYGPELQQNIEQVRALQAQNPEQAAQYEPAIAELTRRQGLTAPDYSASSGAQNYGTMQEAQRAVNTQRTEGLSNVYRGYGMEDKASELQARAMQQELAGYGLSKARREEDTETKILDVDKKASEFMVKRLTGEDGTVRAATADDMIAQIQHQASLYQQAGLNKQATSALKDWQGVAVNAIQLTTAQRNDDLGRAAVALGAGDIKPVQSFYDKYVLDGAKVKNIVENKDGSITVSRVRDDGVPLPDAKIGSRNELLATLKSFQDPMALYNYSQDQFKNNLQVRQVAATESNAKASLSRAEDAKELTGINKKLINARIENFEARTKALGEPPKLTEAQVTARARAMVTNGEINPTTRKRYTMAEAVESARTGGRDPVADALDAALGGDTDPFAND